ncbi:MAG: DUF4406 domain-containing protein [Thaumarchaeota archaeon]|nr:DUF4406 domain-containing protein [Nitrososphaerota archaeon]
MRIYLAGPMRGIPEFNFPAFHATTARLRAAGHTVFSPAERDEATYGPLSNNPTGDEALATIQYGFSLREALGADCAWICAHADAIALLPGWETSKGATAERALGIALGLEIIYLAAALALRNTK